MMQDLSTPNRLPIDKLGPYEVLARLGVTGRRAVRLNSAKPVEGAGLDLYYVRFRLLDTLCVEDPRAIAGHGNRAA